MSLAGTLLDSTLAFCTACGRAEPALIAARQAGVFLDRLCPRQGTVSTRLLADPLWYAERTAEPGTLRRWPSARPLRQGCPRDCGPCRAHAAGLHLPVVSITNQCNLACPICFTYNRPDLVYHKSPEELSTILGHLRAAAPELELINLTGGEPTLHPRLFELLELCTQSGFIGRVTVNTNGLRLAEDRAFARRLKEAGVQVVLSLDTLDPRRSEIIHGRDVTEAKRRALDVLEELAVPATILVVCIRGVNEDETAELADRCLARDFVRGVTIQNMTFTGANGSRFQPREHVTLDEVEALLERQGGFSRADFFPLGAYHPLCYSVAYYLVSAGRRIPLAGLVDRSLLTAATADSYLLDGGEALAAAFREGIDRLWAEGEDEATLAVLRRFLADLYPAGRRLTAAERRARAEPWIKMVYVHPHMDGDNFDLARASRCGDLVPDESGALVPACSYNLLYRQQDARFWRSGP